MVSCQLYALSVVPVLCFLGFCSVHVIVMHTSGDNVNTVVGSSPVTCGTVLPIVINKLKQICRAKIVGITLKKRKKARK